ncbi:MAG: fructosamine kinase family protein [Steroidobacteraceae bacterium]
MSGTLAAALAAALGHAVAADPDAAVHGGCINESFRWLTESGPVFVKRAPLARQWILEAERDGLERLHVAGAVSVPVVLAAGATGGAAFLVLEWLDLRPVDNASDARLGAALAVLHGVQGPAFGLECDNAIGATPQPNAIAAQWPSFWRERRLGFQLDLAARNGYAGRLQDRGRRLLEHVGEFFTGYEPLPSLLHGDLWNGNRAVRADGTPVVFDPAVYFGDSEADIAMTRLFGGFGPRFYAAYAAARPLDAGAATRRDLYNLYHVLNHLNLFGGGYRAQAEAMIDRLLAATGH